MPVIDNVYKPSKVESRVNQAATLLAGSKVINSVALPAVYGVTVIEYSMSDYEQYIDNSVNYSIVTLP